MKVRTGGRSGWAEKLRRFIHTIVRAIRTWLQAFRTAGRPHAGPPARRRNPWPRCIACHRHVAQLCDRGCGVCSSCCDPDSHDDDQDPEA